MTTKSKPFIQIDLDKVEAYASRGLTQEQIALALGVSRSTMMRRLRNKDFKEAYERGKAKGEVAVSNALFDKAVKGNVVACIFILKSRYGWREDQNINVTTQTPLKIVIDNNLTD